MTAERKLGRPAILIGLTLTALASSPYVASDEEARRKYGAYTPKEIYELGWEVQRENVPWIFLVPSIKKLQEIEQSVPKHLATLLYPNAITDLPSAVRLFQRHLGAKQTGEITIEQYYLLSNRYDFYLHTRDLICVERCFRGEPRYYEADELMGNRANVNGVWENDPDEPKGTPWHGAVSVRCKEETMTCEVTQTRVDLAYELDESSNSFKFLEYSISPSTEVLRIKYWGDRKIIAEAGGYLCETELWDLDFTTNEFERTARRSPVEWCGHWSVTRAPKVRLLAGDAYTEFMKRREEERKAEGDRYTHPGQNLLLQLPD